MNRLHCDLCDTDMTYHENKTKVTWEDNEGCDFEFGHVFRKRRKMTVDICDECLALLKSKARTE